MSAMNLIQANDRSGKPLYQVVETHLRNLINSGDLIPGDLIPSEPQLARKLNVSQGTVKKAIDNLVWERLLFRHQGKGTYVSAIDFNNSLFRFTTYGDVQGIPTRIHKETTIRKLEIGSENMCEKLGVPPETKLLFIERVGFVNDEPVMVEYSHWLAHLVPGLENDDIHIPDLMYALIEKKYRLPVVRAEETLTADAADSRTVELLNITSNAPVLTLNRCTYTSENRIIEIRTSKGRADKFSYKAEIR